MSCWWLSLNGKTHWKTTISGVFLIFLLPLLSGCEPASPHVEGAPYHHVVDGFRNPPGSPQYAGSLKETISAYTDRFIESITGYAPTLSPEYILAPEKVRNGLAQIKEKDALTWLGHATFLINLGGKTILTDPFLTEYATGMPPSHYSLDR